MPRTSRRRRFSRTRKRNRRASGYPVNSRATSVALWPPKPKELFITTRTFFSFATFGV